MNDFPDLVPPPERALTADQRDRIRSRLPLEAPGQRMHPWLRVSAAAAVVLLGVGAAVALSRSVGGETAPQRVGPAGAPTPTLPKPHVLCPADGCGPHRLTTADIIPALVPFQAAGDHPAPGDHTCVPSSDKTIVLIGTVTAKRDLVLRSAGLVGAQGLTFNRAWATVHSVGNDVPESGAFKEGVPGLTKSDRWSDRRDLGGAVLRQGQTYHVFVRINLVTGGSLKGIRFDYLAAASNAAPTVGGALGEADLDVPGSAVLIDPVISKVKCT
jgi:hypothetical protein